MLRWKGNEFPKEKRRHLYIVFDEWSRGYSIRKIDLVVRDCTGDYNLPSEVCYVQCSLPAALFRSEAPHCGPKYFAGAFGKIFAMQPMDSQFNSSPMAGVPVYDVRKRSLMIGPQRLDLVDPIYIPVGGRLFALGTGSFQVLYPPRDDVPDFEWTWHELPVPPFHHEEVTSYVEDGLTIFVSVGGSPGIFSFDTANSVTDGSTWNQLGKSQLPFEGRAYFVAELNAWVGLKRTANNTWVICLVDLIPENWDHGQPVKYCKNERIMKTDKFMIGAKLISLGGNKFCVLKSCFLPHLPRIMELTAFSLMYDENGDLTTGDSCQFYEFARIPGVISRSMSEDPVAFWM